MSGEQSNKKEQPEKLTIRIQFGDQEEVFEDAQDFYLVVEAQGKTSIRMSSIPWGAYALMLGEAEIKNQLFQRNLQGQAKKKPGIITAHDLPKGRPG